MKKILSILFCLSFCFCSIEAGAETHSKPVVSASACVLYCVDNSQVIYQKNMNTPMGVASTTKIMTTLLTLEEAEKKDRIIEFTAEMCAEGSSMYLKAGDKVRLSDLAAGMMTVSGNDAANAAAISLAGSKEEFAVLMNKRAEKIGMKNTHFVNPSGLSHDAHYSTAHDMALLMSEALKNETFAKLTAQKSVTVDFVYPADQQVTYYNHNKLLSSYPYCTGGKTGYTRSTGRCLVTSAEHNGLTLVAVTLDASDDWNAHRSMYEYGFSVYKAVGREYDDTEFSVLVAGAEKESVAAATADSSVSVVSTEEAENSRIQVYLQDMLFAPVKAGDVVGKILWTIDGETILTKDIVATEDAQPVRLNPFVRFFYRIFRIDK